MDKKGNRSLPSPKGPTADSKKDVVSKQWPRGGRRREPAGSSLLVKESSRKPQPQRDRTFDKRPKPRGTAHAGAVARNETTWLAEQEAELGSLFLPGSKKQSLNHLLNFSYTSYPSREGLQPERGRAKGGNVGRMLATKKHKYNKEHFLQANCQFIVNDSGDYKQYLNNPDALVDWNLIEQVNVQVSECPSCPICLYEPAAAKMTRCGHIYCWSCILHYLTLSEKPKQKCPICFENVYKQDLKSVVAIPHRTFRVNDVITFKLMKRPKGCLMAYPADAKVKEENVLFNASEREAREVYSKLLVADRVDILNIIERESRELEAQIADDENREEKCFIEQAVVLLQERRREVEDKIDRANVIDREETGEENFESNAGGVDEVVESVDCLNISRDGLEQQAKFHYFYQASDGQHIYLHAINARMLEHTYGSLEFGPATITGRILEKEGGSMTEELRKRLRYLQHLPVTCQFEVAEIQLKQPVVNRETLEHFLEQIDLRRKKRQRRAKEEKRREKRIEAEENRKMGRYPVPNLHLESNVQFPEFGFEARLHTESECTVLSDRSSSSDLLNSSSLSLEGSTSVPSFATMLATQKKQSASWPIPRASSSVSEPVKLINVTGSRLKAVSNAQMSNESDGELEGYEPVPAYNRSFSDAIAQALQMVEKSESADTATSGKKKKKKNKQKLLFTTNMACSGN